ncbi:unnamed protein product, partial [Timema podura]|nr:unnamed protein product [Timema podura]
MGRQEETLKHLMMSRDIAEVKNLPLESGIASRYLGEYYFQLPGGVVRRSAKKNGFLVVAKGATHKAIPALVTSLFKMHQHGTPEQLEQTRAIAAAAAGTDVMPHIGKLILSKDPESLKTLVAWKESQKPFWKEGSYYFAPCSMADKPVGPTADEYAQSYSGLMRVPFVGKDLELLKRLMGDEDDPIPFPK